MFFWAKPSPQADEIHAYRVVHFGHPLEVERTSLCGVVNFVQETSHHLPKCEVCERRSVAERKAAETS